MSEHDVLRWRGVGLTYAGPPPVTALRPCDLLLRSGEQVAVVGPSGSGKSSMLNLLGLLDRPSEGGYELFGRPAGELGERARSALRAAAIGFVFQSFHLIAERTALDNVVLGMVYGPVPRAERAYRARAALEQVGLADRIDARCATLSGGERQRVAIARATAHGPRLLLADEPTGNLDQRTGAEVLDLLDALMSPDMLQVVVTHEPGVAARCSRVIEIVDGRLSGAP